MTWLHATGVVIRDEHTTDEHPQVREVVQLLYRHAPQWCPVPVTLPAPTGQYRIWRAPNGPHAEARSVPPSRPAPELLDTPCSANMLHVDRTALRELLVPWLNEPIRQSGLRYKRPYLQLGSRLVLLNHSWPNELLAHAVSTGTYAQVVPVEVFQCLLGTTLTAQLKALGVLR